MKEGISESCLRQDEGVLSVIYSVVFGRDRACIEYYQKLEIDPVWEVTPAEVSVVTCFILVINFVRVTNISYTPSHIKHDYNNAIDLKVPKNGL